MEPRGTPSPGGKACYSRGEDTTTMVSSAGKISKQNLPMATLFFRVTLLVASVASIMDHVIKSSYSHTSSSFAVVHAARLLKTKSVAKTLTTQEMAVQLQQFERTIAAAQAAVTQLNQRVDWMAARTNETVGAVVALQNATNQAEVGVRTNNLTIAAAVVEEKALPALQEKDRVLLLQERDKMTEATGVDLLEAKKLSDVEVKINTQTDVLLL